MSEVAIELTGRTAVFVVTSRQMQDWEALFPNINVAQCLCSMKVWLDANPSRRPNNVKRFAANWLIGETRRFEVRWQNIHREARVGRAL